MKHTDPLVGVLQQWIATSMRRSMRTMILYMKKNELSMSQIGALFQIHHGRTNVSDLGEALGITTAAASQMLERMVQQELIERYEDPQDRRAKRLILTNKGCRIVEDSLQARQGWLEGLVSTLSVEEKEQIGGAVEILIDKANQLDRSSEPGQ